MEQSICGRSWLLWSPYFLLARLSADECVVADLIIVSLDLSRSASPQRRRCRLWTCGIYSGSDDITSNTSYVYTKAEGKLT